MDGDYSVILDSVVGEAEGPPAPPRAPFSRLSRKGRPKPRSLIRGGRGYWGDGGASLLPAGYGAERRHDVSY